MPQDNLPLDAPPPAGSKLASREGTYSGQTAHAQALGLVEFAGPDDGKTLTDVAIGTIIGPTNETPPASDTGVAGLNGMLKRLCQLITLLLARFPGALSAGGFLQMAIAADAVGSATEGTDNTAIVTPNGKGIAVSIGGVMTLLPAKFFVINRNTAADGAAVVNLVAARRIMVVRFRATCAGAVGMKWQSSTSNATGTGVNTDLSGLESYAANGGVTEPYCPIGVMQTNVGEALKLNLNGAVQVSGNGTYVEIP